MSQQFPADQHTSTVTHLEVVGLGPSPFPIVMVVTSADPGIYVADARLTKWEAVEAAKPEK